MLSKNDIERLAQVRLEDAILLFQSGKSSSAYYLAGYSVELALKACISKLFQSNVIPDKALVNATHTHNLNDLLNVSGLLPQFKNETKSNHNLAANWGIVSKWNEASRYQLWDQITAATLIQSIQDPNNGVFQWVKKYW
jgi:hypothetical protein